jgi:recombination protein RecT
MSNQNQLALVKKDTVDVVAERVKHFQEAGEIHFPAGYSPENAMKSAWLVMQETQDRNKRPALEVCTRDSIANALLDMVVQGLNTQKKQGYFIVYGNTLTFQRSYFGTMAVTKRVTGAKEINANVIYEGDDVDYEMTNGKITSLTHKQKFGNINKENIIGAYCTIVLDSNTTYHEIMTMDEIRQAWAQSQMWGKGNKKEKEGSTHEKFRQEMAKKTVINRACKKFMNSSDDSSLVIDHFNRQDDVVSEAKAQQEIDNNANKEELDFEDAEYTEVDQETGEINSPEENEQQSDVDKVMQDMDEKEKSTSAGLAF